MSTQNTATRQAQLDAGPGMVDTDQDDLVRASESAASARQAVLDEERRFRVDSSARQQQQLEDTQRDLLAAEAFEESLDDGRM